MVSQLTGAVVNIILDPIMIFGLLGFPQMGVAGAALATIIGQFCSMFVSIWANLAKNRELELRIRSFRPSWHTIKNIYRVGLPSIVMQSIGSVMVSGMNLILKGFGTTPVAVFNVYFKLQSFVFMPVIGLNNGMVPIIAFNYGAQNRRRIEKTVRLATIVAFCIMTVGTLIFWILPTPLLRLFDAQEGMLAVGIPALRTISLSFPLAAICIMFSGSFQALGQGLYSLMMSVVRQLVFLLPLAWVLSRIGGLSALWFCFPLAELVCIACAVYLFARVRRKTLSALPHGAD
jgi:putative MATE family efflux protein